VRASLARGIIRRVTDQAPSLTDAVDRWKSAPTPLRLSCRVQPYAWGQRNRDAFIPALLGLTPKPDEPYAELWIGGHPLLPATLSIGGVDMALDRLIAIAGETVMGAPAIGKFGAQLPFLMKVLAAARPLSIQAHPNRAQAEAGFAREEAAGIPFDAPARNYRDPNHKPELIVALTPFFALDGFRPVAEIVATLKSVPELAPLLDRAAPAGVDDRSWLRDLFSRVMSAGAADVDVALQTLVRRLDAEDASSPFAKDRIEHWVLRASRLVIGAEKLDRGLLALLLLNLVVLEPGQALYLDAGEPHAYLEGVGVEVMANSDNVLRGGLTPKHVDVPELLNVLTFRGRPTRVLRPDAGGVYPTPVAEFEATDIKLAGTETYRGPESHGAVILLALGGEAVLETAGTPMPMKKGDVVLIPAALRSYSVHPIGPAAHLFQSGVPMQR
jgi:mannose-6-phosphate isomerase class I